MRGRSLFVALAIAALGLYLVASSVYIVNQAEQALVVRLGAPVGVVD
jgi:regulator of protease activity HflC (stomatin/prohibitin superfamily)